MRLERAFSNDTDLCSGQQLHRVRPGRPAACGCRAARGHLHEGPRPDHRLAGRATRCASSRTFRPSPSRAAAARAHRHRAGREPRSRDRRRCTWTRSAHRQPARAAGREREPATARTVRAGRARRERPDRSDRGRAGRQHEQRSTWRRSANEHRTPEGRRGRGAPSARARGRGPQDHGAASPTASRAATWADGARSSSPRPCRAAKLDDLVATVDHAGVPIGRYPTTLKVEDRSGRPALVRAARLRAARTCARRSSAATSKAGSWRMVVGRDDEGARRRSPRPRDRRAARRVRRHPPPYPASTVELRSAPATHRRTKCPKHRTPRSAATSNAPSENRPPAGSLRVEDRAELPRFETLADAFRSRGFPDETATITADEFRRVTFAGGTVTQMNQMQTRGRPLRRGPALRMAGGPAAVGDRGRHVDHGHAADGAHAGRRHDDDPRHRRGHEQARGRPRRWTSSPCR